MKIWDEWNGAGGPRYPHGKVIQYTFRRFGLEREGDVFVLDLGCGSGVHCAFFAREGFRVTGVDISEVGVRNTRERLDSEGLVADELAVAGCDEISFENRFDLVCCVGVLECCGPSVAKSSMPLVERSLRPGGGGIFLFAAEDDMRFSTGENPLGLHPYSLEEVEEVFLPYFSKVNIDEYITTFENRSIRGRDWLITVEK